MARIAKSDVNEALRRAGDNILKARGEDPVAARADVEAMVSTLSSTAEADVTMQLFNFVDRRDAAANSRVTAPDVESALAYAKDALVGQYDLNANGLSAGEIERMSRLGKFAVAYAKELKASAPTQGRLDTPALGAALTAAAEDTFFVSEGDYPPEFFAAPATAPAEGPIGEAEIRSALGAGIVAWYQADGVEPLTLEELAFEVDATPEAQAFLDALTTVDPDVAGDAYYEANAAGFGRIKAVLDPNVTDLAAFKAGPADEDGSLAVDQGTYLRAIFGRTVDGQLAGVRFGDVET